MMRKSRSVFFAAYLPFRCFLRAERPSFNTMFGSMPNSFDAFRSETCSDRIFETTCATESHVSWNFLDREKYCRAVVGTLSRRFLIVRRTTRFRFLRRDFLCVLPFIGLASVALIGSCSRALNVSSVWSRLNPRLNDLGMKITQPTEKKPLGRPRGSSLDQLLNYEYLWVDTLRGLRDGNPEVETETLAGGSVFIKGSGQGQEWVHLAPRGKKPRIIRQQKFGRTPDEIRRWRVRVKREEEQFEKGVSSPVRAKTPLIPSERRLWEALKSAGSAAQVRRICSQSKIWLKPRLEFGSGSFIEHWPFRRALYRDAEKFCRAKLDPRYPRRDNRKSGDYRRIEYLARVLAGLTLRLAPSTAVEMLRKTKHAEQCQCWRCMRGIAPSYHRSLAHLLASGDWFRQL